jgi:hypothetical protein
MRPVLHTEQPAYAGYLGDMAEALAYLVVDTQSAGSGRAATGARVPKRAEISTWGMTPEVAVEGRATSASASDR